jgi:hypothetical protein
MKPIIGQPAQAISIGYKDRNCRMLRHVAVVTATADHTRPAQPTATLQSQSLARGRESRQRAPFLVQDASGTILTYGVPFISARTARTNEGLGINGPTFWEGWGYGKASSPANHGEHTKSNYRAMGDVANAREWLSPVYIQPAARASYPGTLTPDRTPPRRYAEPTRRR